MPSFHLSPQSFVKIFFHLFYFFTIFFFFIKVKLKSVDHRMLKSSFINILALWKVRIEFLCFYYSRFDQSSSFLWLFLLFYATKRVLLICQNYKVITIIFVSYWSIRNTSFRYVSEAFSINPFLISFFF